MNQSNKNTQIKRSKRHMRYARGNTMNFLHTTMQQVGRAAVRVFAFALLTAMPMMAAQAAVDIDQSPLILQKPLPPNIVLMLDDSGSMAWDFMPDACFLKGVTCASGYYGDYITNYTNDALRDSNNNQIYYNPNVTYTPPAKATLDASGNPEYYPNSPSLDKAYNDGFTDTSPVDISSYKSESLADYNYPYSSPGSLEYFTPFSVNISYQAKENCGAGYTYYNYYGSDLCYKSSQDYYFIDACPSGGSYSSSTKTCTGTQNKKYFTYTTGPANGPYTQHYVAKTGECSLLPSPAQANCTDTAAAQQNVANWFSYYRTRILTAKTGLTLAFAGLDKTYRFGFASINGRNTADIPSPQYSFSTSNNSDNKLAEVQPFGDGSSGTQKAKFWTWITNISPNDGTPLRGALKAVGEYYKTAQPWQSTDKSGTHEYACRPSYTILTTDGFWNGSNPNVGNVDNTDGTKITTPSTYQYLKTAPYLDGYSNTLADVAMKYWETDLRPTVDNEVPTTPNDPAFWQHMTTFTMGLGWDPTALIRTKSGDATLTVPQIFDWARTGTPPSTSTLTSTSNIWPKPTGDSINNIADLAHAAVNGHGDFFSVKSPDDLVNGMKSALAAIADRQGAGNAITNSENTLPTISSSTDPFFQFRATYYTGQWTGALTASTYDTSTTPPSYVPDWNTNSLSASFSDVTSGGNTLRLSNRNVWTTSNGLGGTDSEAFRKASDLTSAQQTGLGAYSVSTVSAQTMLNYLLGDSTYAVGNPSGTLRARKAFLGDVVSSTPVYVAKPDPLLYANATFTGMTGTNSYANFVTSKANRAPMVYVAANDGMLHAFRAKSGSGWARSGSTVSTVTGQAAGTEVYAYMPSAVLTADQSGPGSITNLANPQYGVVNAVDGTQPVPHQYYNDGRITTQNVYFGSAWHTVLVGTTGRGPAKAIYALDITDPTVLMNPATAKNALLWERSAGDGKIGSSYIGEMVGAPVIAQIKKGGTTSWAVLVGNGYNSAANKPALLQFDLQTGALSVHTAGATTNDGLAEPGLMQGDKATGISTYAFAGDLNGNLWKFDLSSSTSAGTVAFVAKDDTNATQPITSLVSIAYDSSTNSTFALFGTGKYLTQDDTKDKHKQTWYGVRIGMGADLAGTASSTTPVADSSTARSDLTQRFAFDDTTTGDRATSAQDGSDMNKKAGWYMDLPQSGERIVNRTQFIRGKAVASTLIPKVDDPCNTVPAGAVMGVDPFTGANQSYQIAGAGYGLGTKTINVNGKAQIVAINGKVFPAGPAAGVTAVVNPDGTVSISFNTMGGGLGTLGPLNLGGTQGARLSWRELTN